MLPYFSVCVVVVRRVHNIEDGFLCKLDNVGCDIICMECGDNVRSISPPAVVEVAELL